MLPQHYKLDANRKPVPCDPEEAMIWRATNDALCHVGVTQVGDAEVSTVFLVMDHGHGLSREPLIFETAVFQANGDVDIVGRTSTWGEAEAMHNATVTKRRAMLQ
jgi:uncharacterized protein YijF (DUF1287 family)